MFLCEPCHATRCEWVHFVTSFGPCEVCKQRTLCWDCQKRLAGSEAQGTERRNSGGSGFDSRTDPGHPISPAVPAEVWAYIAQHGIASVFAMRDDDIVEEVGLDGTSATYARIALSNASLPDDHPGKLTRRDADDLFYLHIAIDAALPNPVDAKPLHEALDTHIAKITAILPQQ